MSSNTVITCRPLRHPVAPPRPAEPSNVPLRGGRREVRGHPGGKKPARTPDVPDGSGEQRVNQIAEIVEPLEWHDRRELLLPTDVHSLDLCKKLVTLIR